MSNGKTLRKCARSGAVAAVFAAALAGPGPLRADQPPSDAVGRIEGEAILVTGPMSVEVVAGQTETVLRSGADVRVKSGTARIDLPEGGQITICGPAHFSVLKSGAALTIALDSGTVHAYTQGDPAITFYTAQIKAEPISINAPGQETLVGIDPSGALCVHATRAAVRLEQQLTGQMLIVPQAADVLISNGQFDNLRSEPGHCACELQLAKVALPEQAPAQVGRLATSEELARRPADKKPSSPDEEVTYSVYVPPLVYDAKKKVQPDFDPSQIVLVRRVRVRPTLIFQGRVEGEAVTSAAASPALAPSPAPPGPASLAKPAGPSDSFVDRVRTFMRRLWSRGS